MLKPITSRDNPRFRQLKKLAESARERRKAGRTLLDGAHLFKSYAEVFGAPQVLVVAQGHASPEVAALLAEFEATETLEMPPAMFAELSPVATPTGLLALIDIPEISPAQPASFGMMLEDVQDPGNLGSLLRSAAAAGVDRVWLSAGCADAWSPKALRGGQGAHFKLPLIERADLAEVARGFSGQVLAASLHGSPLYDVDLSGPVVFMIGNEGAGLSQALLESATRQVSIPMPGGIESLNAAAAAAVCLFEKVRQTHFR